MTEEQKKAVFNDSAFCGNNNCTCGSGLDRKEIVDARGIFVTYACKKCYSEKLDGYRYDIFTDSSYYTDEQVEPEDDYFLRD
jgi:hypothetical protein